MVPPTSLCGGFLAFFVSLVLIGGLTALIGDLADQMGCCMGLKASVTAITFVALGTPPPATPEFDECGAWERATARARQEPTLTASRAPLRLQNL